MFPEDLLLETVPGDTRNGNLASNYVQELKYRMQLITANVLAQLKLKIKN